MGCPSTCGGHFSLRCAAVPPVSAVCLLTTSWIGWATLELESCWAFSSRSEDELQLAPHHGPCSIDIIQLLLFTKCILKRPSVQCGLYWNCVRVGYEQRGRCGLQVPVFFFSPCLELQKYYMLLLKIQAVQKKEPKVKLKVFP